MKNITLALDEDTYRKPMICAFARTIVTAWSRADSDPPLHTLRG